MNRKVLIGLICGAVIGSALGLLSCKEKEVKREFVRVEKGEFLKDGKPVRYIGTNFWYGAILGSTGTGGNRELLAKELDLMKSVGVTNLRVLVGADGLSGVPSKVEPTLQTAPGVYNDTILDGLDFFMAELGKRDMYAVLYLNNSWEWSGGYSQYLEWAGKGKAPIPAIDGWNAFGEYVKGYAFCDSCQSMFYKHTEFIVARTNRYTGEKYSEDDNIFSWQVGNEPRAFSVEGKELFSKWVSSITSLIKSLDSNHLVSLGSEGLRGAENDILFWDRLHKDKNMDYYTFHLWPFNSNWTDTTREDLGIDSVLFKSEKYLNEHIELAIKNKMPLVLEEFGFPRDKREIDPNSGTSLRDRYYSMIFDRLLLHKKSKGIFAGCNFWAWGGYARASHTFWQKGDQYMGDPSQEPQGLNSVFNTDNTMKIIKSYNDSLKAN